MNNYQPSNTSSRSPQTFYYIWNYLEWGGAQVLFFGLMKEAKKIGDVRAIMPVGSNTQLLKFLDNIEVESEFFDASIDIRPAFSIKNKLQRHWKKFYSELVLLKHLSRIDFEKAIIHTELAPWQSMLILLWMCRKTPVFVTMHNTIYAPSKLRNLLWKIKFQILSRAKNFHLFTANQNTKESLQQYVSDKFLDTVKVIYANVNPEEIDKALNAEIDRDALKRKYNLPENKFLVFCVGQFIDRKGRWIFLEAAQKLAEVNDDIAFVWISNYQPSEEDFERARKYNLGKKFVFLTSEQVGSEHIDLFKLLRLADVFALPSYVEGLPISIIEAMALGIPTVSTKINAIPEAIKNLETGVLIEPGNSKALQEAIQRLKDEPELRNYLATNGRAFAVEKFDEKVVAQIAVQGYTEAYRQNLKYKK